MKFDFHFGKKSINIRQYAVVGLVLSSTIAVLSQCSGISENKLWDLFDDVQRKFFPQTILNEFIIKDPEKLDRRVKKDVDKAIRDYELLTGDDGTVRIPSPRYSEKPIDPKLQTGESRLLGGEMRLCAPWVLDCPPGDVVN